VPILPRPRPRINPGTVAALREVVLLSLTASLNPTLLTGTTVMLVLDRPKGLMFGYLLGAYITSITLGLIIVFSLSESGTVDTTKNTLSPAADIGLGALALIAALAIGTGHPRREKKPDKGPPRWQRELSKGSPRIAFAVGIALTLPGASYLAGLISIHKLDYSTTVTVLLVVGFNVVMLWILELPLLGFLIAPDRTRRAVDRAKAWVFRSGRRVAVWGFSIIGVLLVVKGIIGLIS
jgi:Sap, sulfolipid-1-addressing protein